MQRLSQRFSSLAEDAPLRRKGDSLLRRGRRGVAPGGAKGSARRLSQACANVLGDTNGDCSFNGKRTTTSFFLRVHFISIFKNLIILHIIY